MILEKTMNALKKEVTQEEYRVFELFLEKYTYEEISETENFKKKKVDNTIQKCKKIFKNLFERYQNELRYNQEWFLARMN